MEEPKNKRELLPEGIYMNIDPVEGVEKDMIAVLGFRFLWFHWRTDGSTFHRVFTHWLTDGFLRLTAPGQLGRLLCGFDENGSLWIRGNEYRLL